MKHRNTKPLPPYIPQDQLTRFVESQTQISKETLVSRLAGNVDYSVFYLMKILQFNCIMKDAEGRLSMF